MATDFFQRQAEARRTTAWLIGGFLVALVAITATVFFLAWAAASAQHDGAAALAGEPFPWQAPIGAAAGAAGLIGCGSLYKVVALRAGGGSGVAEGLGGKRLSPDTLDPTERRLLNVTEEMAIASGTPAPPVFLLEEQGINAFAAGYSPSDAVIGVTRGAAEGLTRDELQGVIAHEFSHILNGDMRMSIRMIGVLHGILLLGLIGRLMVRLIFNTGAAYDSRRSNSDSGKGGAAVLVVLAVSVALIVVGSIGSLIGGLIKAAVSRQREYLADASAVQFTRNPGGIAGALKRIGAAVGHGRIKHPRAAELSHMYFTQGVWEGFSALTATHPPLEKRIRALEPNWDGSFDVAPLPAGQAASVADGAAMGFAGGSPVMLEVVEDAVEQVGEPEDRHRKYARELLASIPTTLLDAAHDPFSARAVIYSLLLDRDDEVRRTQMAALAEYADPRIGGVVRRLAPTAHGLDARARLPLVDLTLPALAALSAPQYQRFTRSVDALVAADNRLGLFEWTLSQILLRHLNPKFERVRSPRVKYRRLQQLPDAASVALSTLAHTSNAEQAFDAGKDKLQDVALTLREKGVAGLDGFRDALGQLAQLPEGERGRFVDAAAAVICADDHVSVAEIELLRGVSDMLDCPMPPLLAGQRVAA